MSKPEERSNVGGGSSGGGGGADDNDEDEDQKKRERGYGCGHGRVLRKAKEVVLFPFRKGVKKQVLRRNKRPTPSPSPGKTKKVGGGVCFLCFTQPPTSSDSPVDSQTSDPNNPDGFLRALIEKNDFYSKECNPHIDISSSYTDD